MAISSSCWWAIVFAFCITGCSYMIKEIVDKWNKSPVLVALATVQTPIYKIPFPAVTICPETKITRKCLNYSTVLRAKLAGEDDTISEEQLENFEYMAPLCRLENHVNSTRTEPLKNYATFLDKCKSVDLSQATCQFLGKDTECSKILTPIITDDGLCYTFNMFDVRDIYTDIDTMEYYQEGPRFPDWDVEKGYPETTDTSYYPQRVFGTGARKSLIVTFFTRKTDFYASCQDFVLEGLKVSLHIPSSVPRPNQISFPAGLNEQVSFSVIPSLTTTTDEIKGYDPHKRYCFFGNERKLKYFKRYSQSNCNMECWTNYTIQECGCAHFYMPRDANTKVCAPSKMQCLHDAEDSYAVSNFPQQYRQRKESRGSLDNNCDCLPSCADLTYDAEISRVKWNSEDSVGSNESFAVSAVKVFFKTGQFLPNEKSELYGISSFLSNAGGILGLFTGFSLFSLIEIIYFMSIKIIENYRHYGTWFGKAGE